MDLTGLLPARARFYRPATIKATKMRWTKTTRAKNDNGRSVRLLTHIKNALYAPCVTLLDSLRALADPTRLRIMRLLASMELAVGEIAQVLGQSQPRVSRHVKILCDAGLAERRREGGWVFLRAASGEGQANLKSALAGLLAVGEASDPAFAAECAGDRHHLDAIRAARQASAEDYFAAHAEEWDSLRSLHIADGPVELALAELLGADSLGRLLDIGTGTGRMAELFADRAAKVTGLDRSPEMLRLARARLQDLPTDRFELVRGDFTDLPFDGANFDTVLLHQVLHYAQAPELVLAEAARVTCPGGRLAIIDFAAHGREDLRERHAHARLGFSDAQMNTLFNEAGYRMEAERALAGHELIVKIWIGVREQDAGATPLRRTG